MKSRLASKYQELFWLTWRSNPFQPSLVLTYIYKFQGTVDSHRLEQAIHTYTQTFHPDCLSSFINQEGTLFQQFETEQFVSLKYVDLRSEEKIALEVLDSFLSKPFDLKKPPLARFILARTKRKEFLFGFSFSHIIFDGMGLASFIDHLSRIYNQEHIQYDEKDVALTELKVKETLSNVHYSFWKQELEAVSFHQNLSFKVHSGNPDLEKKTRSLSISGSLFAEVKNFLLTEQLTAFRFLTSVYIALLGKYSETGNVDRQQFVVGHSVSMRKEEKRNGCFVNFLPLKITFDSSFNPLQLIEEVKAARKKIKPHQDVSFLELIERSPDLVKKQDYFDLFVNESPGTVNPQLLNFKDSETVALVKKPSVEGRYTFGLHFAHSLDSIEILFGYDDRVLTDEWVESYCLHYIEMIRFFIQHKTTCFKHWNFNPIIPAFLKNPFHKHIEITNLDDALEKALQAGGNKIAIRFGSESLTYKQVEEKVTEAAHLINFRLFKLNGRIKKQEFIGIYIDRSIDMIISLLAILKSGHVFLPLDPSYPSSRLMLFIQEANCKWIISNEETKRRYPESPLYSESFIQSIFLGQPAEQIILEEYAERTLAYLLFTSGSTGKPKGVKVSRNNLLYFLTHIQKLIDFKEGGNFLAATSLNFDISLMEILLPILYGGSITLIDRKTAQNAIELGKKLDENPVNFFQATPSTWKILENISWKPVRSMTLLSGGEPLSNQIADYLLSCSERVFNLYGPTEATIWASGEKVKPNVPISIGRPFPGTTFYIRSQDGSLCPVGKSGELCIAGPGVAQGYLHAPTPSAFFKKDEVIDERFYRTGDLVIYLGEGLIRFLGRMNDEVKVRGHRISLKEIQEAVLSQGVKSQVEVIVRKEPEEHLICFIHSSGAENYEFLLKRLQDQFPSYMIPQQFIPLKKFPLTPSTKTDRKFLENEDLNTIISQFGFESSSVGTKSQDEKLNDSLSEALIDLIDRSFGIKIANDQDSIAQYGFQSISMNRLAKEINQKFGVSISPHTFFQYNTLQEISGLILKAQNRSPLSLKDGHKILEEKRKWDIGIIGMSGIFPQSSNVFEFWDNLCKNKNGISSHSRPYLPTELKAGFIDQVDRFDPAFFNISPLEAGTIDPQQRMLMEIVWHAIEDAGYDSLTLANQKVGVYVTSTSSDYWLLQNKYAAKIAPYTIGGFSNSILANRISYFFNWSGPSMHIETACSGSLSAFAKACEDLAQGKCDWAIVGATNLILSPEYHLTLEKSNLLSPTHQCAALDATADGYVRGEGIGCLVLRRYSDIHLAKEHCYAVVESIAENHGGRSHSLSAPRQSAQTALLLAAYSKDLAQRVSYIELHGTGTKLGDPIEVDALKDAWSQLELNRPSNRKIFLGSVKTQIGHLEAAAGLASIIKVLLAFKYKRLPKNGHFHHLNPLISLEGTNFSILQENIEWEDVEQERVAGISSFGFGGSNVHVVLRECLTAHTVVTENSSPHLFCISARSLISLKKRLEELSNWLKQGTSKTDFPIGACSYSLNVKRTHFEFRIALIASTREELILKLEERTNTLQAISRTKLIDQKIEIKPDSNDQRLEVLHQIAHAYTSGYSIDWNCLYSTPLHTAHLNIPLYPFNHSSYWFETTEQPEPWYTAKKTLSSEKKETNQISLHSFKPGLFEIEISVDHHWLKDHLVCGTPLLPGVAYLELVYQCFKKLNPTSNPNYFYNVHWINPLICMSQQLKFEISLELTDGAASYTVHWQDKIYGSGFIGNQLDPPKLFEYSQETCQKYLENRLDIYALFDTGNISYGPFFQNIYALSVYPKSSEVKIILEETKDFLKTNLLDSAMQSILGLNLSDPNQPLLPFAIGRLRFYESFFKKPDRTFHVVTRKISNFRVDIFVLDSLKKEVLIECLDVGVRQVNYEIFKINQIPSGSLL